MKMGSVHRIAIRIVVALMIWAAIALAFMRLAGGAAMFCIDPPAADPGWGRGDGSGLTVFETAVGRIGALICWEHYMPLARYALIAKGEEIHCSHFPGSVFSPDDLISKQIDAAIRHHAMESGAFVVNATGWLTDKQRIEISSDESFRQVLQGGICTAIVSPFYNLTQSYIKIQS